eukprot:1035640-Prymnesium_polylepis.1
MKRGLEANLVAVQLARADVDTAAPVLQPASIQLVLERQLIRVRQVHALQFAECLVRTARGLGVARGEERL